MPQIDNFALWYKEIYYLRLFFFFRILVISILICFFMRSKRLTLVLVTFPNNHIEI